jgi:DNA-binding Lrp family transcriptional regulator
MNKNLIADWIKKTYTFRVITRVTLETNDIPRIAAFETAISDFREIELAHHLTGEASFILFVAVISEKSYKDFLARLNKIPGVKQIDSVFKQTGFKTFAAYGASTENPITRFEVK